MEVSVKNVNINFHKGKLLSGIIYPEFFPLTEQDTVLNVGCGDGVQAVIYQGRFKSMIGVDLNKNRLAVANQLVKHYGINNFSSLCSNVEEIPLTGKFNKIIAIDIIEHVVRPERLISELNRLLSDDGKILITFPAWHDKWENFFRFVGRKILRRRGKTVRRPGWDPDAHQYGYNLRTWLKLMERGGFSLEKSRASTLFPPLHYLGLPKFWFSNKFIHGLDNYLCQLAVLKNYGQALVCVFTKAAAKKFD